LALGIVVAVLGSQFFVEWLGLNDPGRRGAATVAFSIALLGWTLRPFQHLRRRHSSE
jgi:hypothetical protein